MRESPTGVTNATDRKLPAIIRCDCDTHPVWHPSNRDFVGRASSLGTHSAHLRVVRPHCWSRSRRVSEIARRKWLVVGPRIAMAEIRRANANAERELALATSKLRKAQAEERLRRQAEDERMHEYASSLYAAFSKRQYELFGKCASNKMTKRQKDEMVQRIWLSYPSVTACSGIPELCCRLLRSLRNEVRGAHPSLRGCSESPRVSPRLTIGCNILRTTS
jgi:hypothetical protein